VVTTILTVTNSAATDGWSENLNVTMTGQGSTSVNTTSATAIVGLAPGDSNAGSAVLKMGTGITGPRVNGNLTITPVSDGTGTSGLGTTAISNQVIKVYFDSNVYNYAASAVNHAPVDAGKWFKGSTALVGLGVTNTAPAGAYSEALDAAITSSSGDATHNSGSFNLLAAGATDNTSLLVGITTATTGAKSGEVIYSRTSDGTGTSGLANTALADANVVVVGTVWDHSTGSLSGSEANSLVIVNLGSWLADSGLHSTAGPGVWNLAGDSVDYTAKLDLLSVTPEIGNTFLTTDLATFINLVAGESQAFNASFDTAGLGTGTYTRDYTLNWQDAASDGISGGADSGSLTLRLQGNIIPEPGTLALIGMGALGMILRAKRRGRRIA
jgi:hypothetical protein